MTYNKLLTIFFVIVTLLSCKKKAAENPLTVITPPVVQTNEFAIVIHGGAGYLTRKNVSSELDSLIRSKLTEAIKVGHIILKEGGSSLDAVEKTIQVLENSPLFNAGKGAVYTHQETNEMDASIMYGATLDAGAVAGVTIIKNPISAARKVMENSAHVLLSGTGADQFAKEQGIEIVDSSYFATEKRLNYLRKVKAEEQKKTTNFLIKKYSDYKFGTVGCVALDTNGNISAGTSTGGMTNKKWSRIGDSPIIGAGTYANNKTCGVSSTGHGEYFIRAAVAHDISAQIEYKKVSLKEAAENVVQQKLVALKGSGGIIAIDKYGNIQMEFNTPGMYRASINQKGELYTGIYKDE